MGWSRRAEEASPRPRSSSNSDEASWLDPAQCALLVLDCQPEVVDELSHHDTLIFRINTAIEIARRHGTTIVFSRIAFDDLDYSFTPSTNEEFSTVARQRRFTNGSREAELHQSLVAQSHDVVVRKTRLGVFSTTDLDKQLTNLGVTTLITTGVTTSGAVLSTIREAADRDYRIVVMSDCMFDTDRYMHEFLMENVFPRQAMIANLHELDPWLTAGADVASTLTATNDGRERR